MARTRQPQPSVPSDTFKELEKAVEELEHSGAPQVLNRATSPFYARLSLYFKPDEVQEVNLDLDKLLPTPRAATRDDARDLRGNFLHWRSVKGSFERLFPRGFTPELVHLAGPFGVRLILRVLWKLEISRVRQRGPEPEALWKQWVEQLTSAIREGLLDKRHSNLSSVPTEILMYAIEQATGRRHESLLKLSLVSHRWNDIVQTLLRRSVLLKIPQVQGHQWIAMSEARIARGAALLPVKSFIYPARSSPRSHDNSRTQDSGLRSQREVLLGDASFTLKVLRTLVAVQSLTLSDLTIEENSLSLNGLKGRSHLLGSSASWNDLRLVADLKTLSLTGSTIMPSADFPRADFQLNYFEARGVKSQPRDFFSRLLLSSKDTLIELEADDAVLLDSAPQTYMSRLSSVYMDSSALHSRPELGVALSQALALGCVDFYLDTLGSRLAEVVEGTRFGAG